MNKAKLYSALAMKEMHVNDFLKELNNHGLKLSESAYYSRIRGEQEFDIKEIKTIVKVLNLTREEMNDIFLENWCPKRHLRRHKQMQALQTFNFEELPVRTLTVDNEPYFVGKDVAEILGYSNTRDALSKHVDEDDKEILTSRNTTLENLPNRGLTAVNESGLYSLIFSSKLESAKRFKRWVTSDVLPAIRKHGIYATDSVIENTLNNPDYIINILTEYKKEKEQNLLLQQEMGELKPKADYVDEILKSTGTLATTQIAADYGISAQKLNKLLHEARLQRKVNKQWVLYSEHMGKSYTESDTIPIVRSDGREDTVLQTRWTQKGRLKIHEIMTEFGYEANVTA